MAIKGVDKKCYILALFVRDDGERFLLGSGHYEFKDTQMHFAANAIQNDIVEVQGNDGFLLAGQVRRPGTQSFDGYVGDGTMSKEETESYRRQFFSFFRKNFFYKVIYVFSDGTAIQRKSGFLVDDPTVEELYQMYPEYHVALNFEDVNYYSYSEDEEGQEQYAKEATIDTSSMRATGGLVWDNYGVVWEDPWSDLVSVSGSEIQIDNEAGARAPIQDLELQGDTYQQTYSGKNLIDLVPMTNTQPTRYQQCTLETVMDATLGRNIVHISGTNNYPSVVYQLPQRLESGKYYALKFTYRSTVSGSPQSSNMWFAPSWSANNWDVLGSINSGRAKPGDGDTAVAIEQSTTWKTTSRRFYVDPSQYSSTVYSYTTICFSLGYDANSTKELWLADAEVYKITEDEWNADTYTSKDYQPYTGGIPAPNPDYPQNIQTVTGEQTVTVTGKNLYNPNTVVVNKRLGSDGALINDSAYSTSDFIKISPSVQYAYTRYASGGGSSAVCFYDSERNFISRTVWSGSGNTGRTYFEFTTPQESEFVRICDFKTLASLQFEKGVTSAYEPYQSLSYTVNLGSIELCKIGNYQDYIYKSGDGWYVHKETGKQIVDVSAIALRSNYSNIEYGTFDKPNDYGGYGAFGYAYPIVCTHAIHSSNPGNWNSASNIGRLYSGAESYKLWIGFAKGTGLDAIKTKLTGCINYYALGTPTDTEITDDTLIAQLNALGAMKLFIGENNLIVHATGTNLPAPLSFKYYTTVAMTGAEWEEGGSGGATVVEVDSITNTYPIWRVKGPAVDPQLSVINTNTTIRYTGTVTSTQTLEIDMFNKTAKLNGVSVIGNVSGDWVSLAPGTNRVIYTAENADAQPSTIEWQEVVG